MSRHYRQKIRIASKKNKQDGSRGKVRLSMRAVDQESGEDATKKP